MKNPLRKIKGFGEKSPEDLLGLKSGREKTERLLKELKKSLASPVVVGRSILSRRLVYSMSSVAALLLFLFGFFVRGFLLEKNEEAPVAIVKEEIPNKSPPPQFGAAEPEKEHSHKPDLPVAINVAKPPVVKKKAAFLFVPLPENVLVLPSPDTSQKASQDTASQEQPPVIAVVDPPKEEKRAQVKKGLLPKLRGFLRKR